MNCDRQRIPCENENCNVMALRIDLGEHMNNRCLYRKKTCTHCADKYIFAEEEVHFTDKNSNMESKIFRKGAFVTNFFKIIRRWI